MRGTLNTRGGRFTSAVLLGAGLHACLLPAITFVAHADAIPVVCVTHVKAISALNFDNEKHKRWYGSWWDGECTGLSLIFDFCVKGKSYPATFIDPVLAENPSVDTTALVRELCTLGELIGLEYARDNGIRCLDMDDVRRWGGHIKDGQGDVFARIGAVRSEAKSKIARVNCPN